MNASGFQQEIIRLLPALTEDMPVRQMVAQKSELGCVLLRAKEFFIGEEYWSIVQASGLSRQTAQDCISYTLKRNAYRWL